MENNSITFGTLRKYLSIIDRLSICMEETLQYENFIYITDVPDCYDNLYVYGIGIIESEFYKDGEYRYTVAGDREDLTFVSCVEIVLSKEPRTDEEKQNPIDELKNKKYVLNEDTKFESKIRVIKGEVDEATLIKMHLEKKEEERRLKLLSEIIRLQSEINNVPRVIYDPETK